MIRFIFMLSCLVCFVYGQTCKNYVGENGYYPPENSQCSCATTENCIGKCCPSTGKCQSASCDGNDINKGGHEKQCVVDKDGFNKGANCPFNNPSWSVVCSYVGNCAEGKNNNCYGYTKCLNGVCPSSAIGVFCIESGNSDNFKVCGCDPLNCDATNTPDTKSDYYVNAFNKVLIVAKDKGVLSNDKNYKSAQVVTPPTYGSVVMGTNGEFTYTPLKDFCGTDTFRYKVVGNQVDECSKEEDVVITTTCGCGQQVEIIQCKLDTQNPTTDCVLPGGKILTVASQPGYTRVRIRIQARIQYKV